MVISQQDQQDALKIVVIYRRLHSELEKIEKEVEALDKRKSSLLENLESTRQHEQELLEKIRAANPGETIDFVELAKMFLTK